MAFLWVPLSDVFWFFLGTRGLPNGNKASWMEHALHLLALASAMVDGRLTFALGTRHSMRVLRPTKDAGTWSHPKAESRDPQVKDLYHGELVVPPGELALNSAD